MSIFRIVSAGLVVLAVAADASAERYALLVGVSRYAATGNGVNLNLAGPAQDVSALRQALISREGFLDRNIVALVDEAATHQAILGRLAERISTMRDGDYLLFYFSGHGTSAFDAKMQPLSPFIGPNSGALAPHDLRIDSTENAAASLIIGQRDLRPLLQRLPPGSEALVILDACYSENSVRAIEARPQGRVRGITVSALVADATPGRKPAPVNTTPGSTNAAADRAYPYSNVVALTAASKDEPAIDIDERLAVSGRLATVDGKPHGAFTNSLLEGLGGAADLNHDGTITFQELHDFTRQRVQARFPHTPQILAPASPGILQTPAFAFAGPSQPAACDPVLSAPLDPVRVQLDRVSAAVRSRLTQNGITVVDADADVAIVERDTSLDAYDAAGQLMRTFPIADLDALVARVRAEPALRRFVEFRPACPGLNVSLRLTPEGESRFSTRQSIQAEARLDRPAHLLLFDIDRSGTVSVVYPATVDERRSKPAGQAIPLGALRAAAPFGSEHLKLLGFTNDPPLERLGCRTLPDQHLDCPDIQPGTAPFTTVLDLLTAAGRESGESHVRFITYGD